jgi:hypothetical protein
MGKPLMERFMEKVRKGENCWEWIGGKQAHGYGVIRQNGKNKSAHRISYQLFIGIIPDGLCVLHKCDNPSCVNPDHLFLGTQLDNNRDAIAKGRTYYPKGENNHSKLLNIHIPIIRKLHKRGISQTNIAKQYGVSQQLISNIITGKTWKHLPA